MFYTSIIIYWSAKNEVRNKIRKVQGGVYVLVIRGRGEGKYLVQKKRRGLRFKIK